LTKKLANIGKKWQKMEKKKLAKKIVEIGGGKKDQYVFKNGKNVLKI
jgi:hypothetical protein